MPISRRQVLKWSGVAAGVLSLAACGDDEAAKTAGAPDITPEQLAFSSGNPKAAVVLQEFISLTCQHCARFHQVGYPMLKERFINQGKLLLVYRDFALDGMALRGSMLMRALPPELGVKLQGVLLDQQSQWINSEGDLSTLKNFARIAGLSPVQIDAILDDEARMDAVIAARQQAVDDYGINSTPSFVIGKDLFGGGSFEEIADWVADYIV
ncbi:MAG: thioredoxin domain-containing protein [Alphaproteobacteria bacterium]|nr:thioredoxin domain-containing protein [Alphaproteobacteria bacterium]